MVKQYLPSDFKNKAEFGTVKSTTNPNTGANIFAFVPSFTLHYKPHTRTLNQQYLATQASLQDSKVIVVRHNKKLTEALKIRLNGIVYDIVLLSPDENHGFNRYDFVTIRKSTKVG
ncbi:phage head closure protein [Streptococcus parasuis]|uniref:phage head closure protein n=1 Tax=Streptococcus parasuis TaxID=1501662 RepID=UPI0025A5E1FD|nr:phage head closure protein [Streptococcus parasuis]WJQ86098.1 phage head closure protein [Streptococcus parasuis]